MKLLNRADVLSANDLRFKDVETPEWGEGSGVRIRNLTAKGRGKFIQRSLNAKRTADEAIAAAKAAGAPAPAQPTDFEIELLLVTMTAVDEKNKPMFTEDDIRELAEKSGAPIGRLAAVAQELSGLNADAAKEAVKPSEKTKS